MSRGPRKLSGTFSPLPRNNVNMSLKYALRRLACTPTFTLIAAVTLAVGIGANGAIFSVIHGVLLKPLPYPHPEELIDLHHTAPGVNFPDADPAPFLYFTYREQGRSFQSLGLYAPGTCTVTGHEEPDELQCLNVTSEILPMLGIPPARGRWFSRKDDSPATAPTMILGYGWWQRRFGGDPSVIGRQITVDGVSREVIGVMPASFRFLDLEPAFLMPLQFDRSKAYLGQFAYPGIARLMPGVTIQQASADIARMIPIALHSFPPQAGLTVKVFEDVHLAPKLRFLRQLLVGDIGQTLWVLMGTLGAVLLIACANVANLLLVRADGRQHELAVRAALGATWHNIARELLTESLALGLFGGALGLGVAEGAVRLLVSMAPAHLPRLNEISIDAAVVLFTFALAFLTGLAFGIVPVVKYASPRIANALRGGGRSMSQSKERHRATGTLVVVQIALALVLLVGAGLMIRTFRALHHVEPGFDPKGGLTFRIFVPPTLVQDSEAVMRLEQGILDSIRAIPGVTSAGITSLIPIVGPQSSLQVYARDKTYQSVPPLRRLKFVSPGLLAAMGNRVIAGRDFTWTDVYQRHPIAMLSENLAREMWGDPRLAIGKEIHANPKDPWSEVVGVVGDERDDGVQQKAPEAAYYPLLMNVFDAEPQVVVRSVSYVVRSRRAGSQSLLTDVQQAVWSQNANLPLGGMQTLQAILDRSLARTSFTLTMLGIAGAMALLIGLVGIYGVIAYSVSRRTREIGIRIALGARPTEMTRLFVAQGLALASIGVVFGLAGAIGLTRLLSSQLFEVHALDPLTYAAVAVVLIAAAVTASCIPALRASAVDPVEALRAE